MAKKKAKKKGKASKIGALDKLILDFNKESIRKQKAAGIREEYIRPAIVKCSDIEVTPLKSTGFRAIDKLMGYSFENKTDSETQETRKINEQWGLRDGRIYTIYGPEGAGKTTFTLQMAAHLQRETGKNCIIIDAEGRFDKQYAEHCGMDMDLTFVIALGDYIEESFDMVRNLLNRAMKTEGIDIGLVIFDSLHAAKPKDEVVVKSKAEDGGKLKSAVDNYAVGVAAKKNNQFLGMILPLVSRYKLHFFIIGQARTELDMGQLMLSGGQAVKHYSETIIKLVKTRRADWPGKGPKTQRVYFGHRARFVVEKAPGIAIGTKVELPYYLGKGFDEREKTIEQAIEDNVIIQAGAWYTIPDFHGDEYKTQGRESLDELFQDEENYVWLLTKLDYEIGENVEKDLATDDGS